MLQELRKNLKKIVSEIAAKAMEKEVSSDDIEETFSAFEIDLIRNGVALAVIDELKAKFKEKLAGIRVKRAGAEEVIRNLIKREILKILSVEKIDLLKLCEESKLKGRPLLLLFLGFNGVGKCVAGDSIVQTNQGKIKFKELYEKTFGTTVALAKDIHLKVFLPPNMKVFSFDFQKRMVRASTPFILWKAQARNVLRITLDNGGEITVTPDHLFFVREDSCIKTVKASDLSEKKSKVLCLGNSRSLNGVKGSTGSLLKTHVVEEINGCGSVEVYDLTVLGYHNFFANEVLIHNSLSLAKVACFLKKRGQRPLIAVGDTFRAAGISQTVEYAKRIGVPFVKHERGSDSCAVIFDSVKAAEARGFNVVCADTAGRSYENRNLMDELKKICRKNRPDLKILVLDGLAGSDIVRQCEVFDKAVGVDALIITKTDVGGSGGAILNATHITKKPILFIGNGQKFGDLIEYNPKEILGKLI